MDGGVCTAGESLRDFIALSASWNGSNDDAIATLVLSSFFAGGGMGAFLNEGSFALGFGAEKNDESAFASFTAAAADLVDVIVVGSLLTVTGRVDDALPNAGFLVTAAVFVGTDSTSFLFFVFRSKNDV